jgi:hypothetical protein
MLDTTLVRVHQLAADGKEARNQAVRRPIPRRIDRQPRRGAAGYEPFDRRWSLCQSRLARPDYRCRTVGSYPSISRLARSLQHPRSAPTDYICGSGGHQREDIGDEERDPLGSPCFASAGQRSAASDIVVLSRAIGSSDRHRATVNLNHEIATRAVGEVQPEHKIGNDADLPHDSALGQLRMESKLIPIRRLPGGREHSLRRDEADIAAFAHGALQCHLEIDNLDFMLDERTPAPRSFRLHSASPRTMPSRSQRSRAPGSASAYIIGAGPEFRKRSAMRADVRRSPHGKAA